MSKRGLIMKEAEFKSLIDREKNTNDAKQYFQDYIELLTDLVNYGSWLLPRAYDSSSKKLADVIILGVLLKQVIAMTDSVGILISNGAVYPTSLNIRAAFEASIFIDWMLNGNSEEKANYYYVSNLRDQRLWASRIIKNTPEEQQFSTEVQELASYFDYNSLITQETANNQLSEVNRILNQGSFKVVDDEFEKLRKKLKHEPVWYQTLAKPPTLRQLAKEVDRSFEYLFLYNTGSKTTHTAAYRDHVQFSKHSSEGTKIVFEPIRWLKGIEFAMKSTVGISLHTYKSIITYYRNGELQNFALKYKNDWQRTYLSVKTVEYKSE